MIDYCLGNDLMYQTKVVNKGRVFYTGVFLGTDQNGNTVSAYQRGLRKTSIFKGDVAGSDKRYGVLYTVVTDKTKQDPTVDILTYSENAPRVNDIIEKYGLMTVKQSAVISHDRNDMPEKQTAKQPKEKETPAEKNNEDFLREALKNSAEPQQQTTQTQTQVLSENPTKAAAVGSHQSARIYVHSGEQGAVTESSRPSVRGALQDIKRDKPADAAIAAPEKTKAGSRSTPSKSASKTPTKNTATPSKPRTKIKPNKTR